MTMIRSSFKIKIKIDVQARQELTLSFVGLTKVYWSQLMWQTGQIHVGSWLFLFMGREPNQTRTQVIATPRQCALMVCFTIKKRFNDFERHFFFNPTINISLFLSVEVRGCMNMQTHLCVHICGQVYKLVHERVLIWLNFLKVERNTIVILNAHLIRQSWSSNHFKFTNQH